MHKEPVHRARRVVWLAALLVPCAQVTHATDGMLYARAIGDPYLPAPAVDRPSTPPRAAKPNDLPELPGLGTTPPASQSPAATTSEGWSWTRVLIGVGVVVAISAIASKGGGSGGGDAAPTSSGPPPTSGGGTAPPPTGGGGSAPAPSPAPTPAPSPTPPVAGGDDDDDDDDHKKGKGRKRILIPAISTSF